MPVIEVRDLSFHRGHRAVLQNVEFTISRHELVGLIGPNGGGKTTLLQVLLGALSQFQGKVTVLGEDPARLGRIRGHIGYVAQTKRFDPDFPARAKDVVMMGTYGQLGLFRRPGAAEQSRTREALEQVGMGALAGRPIGQLSGGEQQRVFIAQALVSEPELLILDEPTVGVDREGEEALIHLLTRLRTEARLTILMVSHNVSLIRSHTDRILCLNRELFYSGSAADLTDAVIAQAYHAHPTEAARA